MNNHSDTHTTKRPAHTRGTRRRWDKVDTRTAGLGAVGSTAVDLGGHAYRVVLNCRSEDDTTNLQQTGLHEETGTHTHHPMKEVTS